MHLCTEVAALVKDIGEEGPWKDIPVRRYTFSWVRDNTQHWPWVMDARVVDRER